VQTQHRGPQHGEENGGDPGEAYVIHPALTHSVPMEAHRERKGNLPPSVHDEPDHAARFLFVRHWTLPRSRSPVCASAADEKQRDIAQLLKLTDGLGNVDPGSRQRRTVLATLKAKPLRAPNGGLDLRCAPCTRGIAGRDGRTTPAELKNCQKEDLEVRHRGHRKVVERDSTTSPSAAATSTAR
jgi:hypothetical protein